MFQFNLVIKLLNAKSYEIKSKKPSKTEIPFRGYFITLSKIKKRLFLQVGCIDAINKLYNSQFIFQRRNFYYKFLYLDKVCGNWDVIKIINYQI